MTENTKSMILLATLLFVGDYCFFELINCTNMIECSFLFSLSLTAVHILSKHVGNMDMFKAALVHSIIGMYYCSSSSVSIQGHDFLAIGVVSIIAFLIATACGLKCLNSFKVRSDYVECIAFVTLCAIVDGIIMSAYYLTKMPFLSVLMLFFQEIGFKVLFAYGISKAIKVSSLALRATLARGK